MLKEEEQFYKEQATILAAKNNIALFDRDLEVYAVKEDGSAMLVSKSEDSNKVWDTALKALKRAYGKRLFNHE